GTQPFSLPPHAQCAGRTLDRFCRVGPPRRATRGGGWRRTRGAPPVSPCVRPLAGSGRPRHGSAARPCCAAPGRRWSARGTARAPRPVPVLERVWAGAAPCTSSARSQTRLLLTCVLLRLLAKRPDHFPVEGAFRLLGQGT